MRVDWRQASERRSGSGTNGMFVVAPVDQNFRRCRIRVARTGITPIETGVSFGEELQVMGCKHSGLSFVMGWGGEYVMGRELSEPRLPAAGSHALLPMLVGSCQ